jgi:hypothetical protein
MVAVLAVIVALPTAALAHELDHPAPSVTAPVSPPTANINSGGPGAKWELLDTLVTGNPHSDLDFFTQRGETYASVGLLGTSANGGGQSIAQLTDEGKVDPKLISQHPSASCAGVAASATGLQHDVEATPKGDVILNTDVLHANRADAQLLLDASDAAGRCHDNGDLGLAGAPRGGLEIIDVTDPAKPVEIALTSHIGEAHTVNVDPRRPHIAYALTSDAIGVKQDGTRENEDPADSDSSDLDGFEVIDLRSCLEAPLGTIPPGTGPMAKRALCKPQVFRFRYPSAAIARGHTVNAPNQGVFGCHEIELYPDDRVTCGSGASGIVFDMSEAFDDNGTPMDFTDDRLRGEALPCALRDSSSAAFGTGAKVTDCVTGVKDGRAVDLRIPSWIAIGSPSLAGVKHLGSVFHQGRVATQDEAVSPFDSTQDIDFDHELERTASGRFLIATDERGGGVVPPGASCSPAGDNSQGNGGLHAYSADRLKPSVPGTAQEAFESYARTPDGKKAIYRARIRTQPQGSFCTAHVFQQIPGQNRIFMGWYSQGTQVVDFVEHANGSLQFSEAGHFIPENANQWVSHIFKVQRNDDGTFTYFGATGDGIVGAGAGRSAIDIYKVTLPAPPAPASGSRIPGTGRGFEPSRCLARRVKIGPRAIGRLKLGQSRARTAQRARPLGNISRRTRVYRYCVRGAGKARGAAVFDRRGKLRLAATNAKGHTRRGLGRGDSVKALRRRFGKRLRTLASGVRIVRAPKRSSSRVIYVVRAGKVRYVAIVDRKLANKRRILLRAYLRVTKLG